MRVGIISFAHGHANGNAQCLARLPDVELVAIADDDETRLRAAVARFGGEAYGDYRQLLARTDVDAVIVTSPNAQHAEHVIAAAAAGKHVLCEKPIATSRSDGQAMVAACREHGVKLQTAFPVRFGAPAVSLRGLVREGAIGTPVAVKATNPGSYPGGWFGDPKLAGGGAVMDHTVHVVDLLRWIFDAEVTHVYAEIDTRLHAGLPVDDVATVMLTLSNGLFASLDPSWSRPKTWPIWGGLTLEVIGDRGVVSMDAFGQNVQLVEDRGPSHRFVPWAEGGDLAMIRGFLDAVRDDTDPPVTGEDGLRALEVALCAYESAKRGEPVPCPDALAG
ncbi:MAG TPA: Gfo/Idh/MocA family oxidoreductase [Thermomicrobiales bacterium]|jgi:predicted dehydrogenase